MRTSINRKPKGYYATRARGPLAKWLNFALYLSGFLFAAYLGVITVNQNDEVGRVGVVSAKANGIQLSCGEKYDASVVAVFHPDLPCGTVVQITNLENGKQLIAEVSNRNVTFRKNVGRTMDISEAAAEKLGFNPAKASSLSLRRLTGKIAGFWSTVPVWKEFQPSPKQPQLVSKRDRKALAQNQVGECHICGRQGQIATSQVALNRLSVKFNGRTSLHGIIFDEGEFSWTYNPKKYLVAESSKAWKNSVTLADDVLYGNLSGDDLATTYLVTTQALYYYAFDVIKTPGWGKRNGNLEVVPMSNTVEVELMHRFFQKKGAGKIELNDYLASL